MLRFVAVPFFGWSSLFADVYSFCTNGKVAHPILASHWLSGAPTNKKKLATTGRQCTVPFSVQKWIISRGRCAMLLNISSQKSKVTRELALVELSLACLMVTWKFSDGSSKRITILSILVRSDRLLFTICFCFPSYVHQQLHLLNFQSLAHAIL